MRYSLFPLLLAANLYLHAQPADPGGWTKIKWGMTLKDVLALYAPVGTEFHNQYVATVNLPDISIAGISFSVQARAKTLTTPITAVWLDCAAGFPATAAEHMVPCDALEGTPGKDTSGSDDFETLKALLIEKYGQPANEARKMPYGGTTHSFLWSFPTTSIELTRTVPTGTRGEARVGMGLLRIEYRPIDRKATDIL